MRDILGQGSDSAPSPWPRRLFAVAAVLLAAIVIVQHLPGRGNRAAPGQRADAATRAPVTAPAYGLSVAGVANQPAGFTGQTLPRDSGLRLPVSGAQPAWFWPATGRTQAIAGLSRTGSGYRFTRAAGGWIVQATTSAQPATSARPGCGGCAGPPLPVYFLGDDARSVTQVGLAEGAAPGARPGTVWLTRYPPEADMSTAAGTALEVSVTGAPLGPRLRLPSGYGIIEGTDRGLLLAPAAEHTGPTAYQLWNPAPAEAARTFDGVIAADASELAWTAGCTPVCRVQVLNLTTGRLTTIELPEASSAASGAFSPDGNFLALEVTFYNGGDAGALALRLEVAPVATGRLAVVPGTWVSSDALAGFGWPAASDTLIAQLSFMTKIQIAAWEPGAARVTVAAIRPGQPVDSLIVG